MPGAAIREKRTFDDNATSMALFGQGNRNLKLVAERTRTEIHARGNEVTVVGDAALAGGSGEGARGSSVRFGSLMRGLSLRGLARPRRLVRRGARC